MSFLSQPISLFPVKPKRQLGAITIDVIISENTTDKLTITKQPIQQGAQITDHAYKEPTTLTMSAHWKDNSTLSLAKIYQNLLDLQNSRQPFTVVTPKRVYNSMLLETLTCTTDKSTENVLAINMGFQQIIIVQVGTVVIDKSKQRNPGRTQATQNTGKQSAAFTMFGGTKF